MELQRQMGFGSYQTAWSWLHKIRKAMVRPDRRAAGRAGRGRRDPGGRRRPGKRGRGAAGKTVVAGAVEAAAARAVAVGSAGCGCRRCADASAASLEAFLAGNVAPPAAVTTDGWPGYAGLGAAGYDHEPINLAAGWGDAVLRLPAIHLVFGLAKRWLLGTHHGAVGRKHLQAYLDEYVFRLYGASGVKL